MALDTRNGGAVQISAEDLWAEIERIVVSEPFRKSERAKRFLRAAAEATLSGGDTTEATIALEVFDRDGEFDPKVDSIVRVEAGRVRAKLAQYYGEEGAGSPFRVRLPKGTYVLEAARAPADASGSRRLLATLGAALAACVALTVWLLLRS